MTTSQLDAGSPLPLSNVEFSATSSHSSQPPQRARSRWTRTVLIVIGLLSLIVGIGYLAEAIPGRPDTSHSPMAGEHEPSSDDNETIPTVKVVRPKKVSLAEIVLERIATVEPYFRADLRARASGIVKAVNHGIGEAVKRGDILIEIDVSDYEQDVAQKEALIVQRQHEMKVTEAELENAKAAREVTAATISQKEAEVLAITATRDLKKGKFERYQQLAARGSIVGSVVEEEERDYRSSEAGLLAAKANVTRARADHAEAATKIKAAAAEVELKNSQIEVARKDLDRAKVVASFGKVIAPFDGVVVKRNVDPGSFVQNATTGSSETLISVSRIDLVTVVGQFPDNAAPYITEGTPAVIQIADLSGAAIFSKVTRFSPTIQNSDRTMRVEIDLFNGDAAERTKLERVYQQNNSAPQFKGSKDTLPLAAFSSDSRIKPRLLPGMNGSIKLAIGGSGSSYVLPSTAVYSRSGATYILIVKDNTTRQVPVRINLNDGQKVRVSIVDRKTRDDGTAHESLTSLTGDEIVVVSNQLQIGEDVQVRITSTEW